MSEDPKREAFKNRWEGLYKIVLLALVLYTAGFDFFVRRTSELAKAELDAVRHILADIELTSRTFLNGDQCFLLAQAKVENKGRNAARVRLDSVPWKFAVVRFDSAAAQYEPFSTAAPRTFTRTSNRVVPLPLTTLVPGEVAEYEAVVKVPRSQIVFAEFRVPVSEDLTSIMASDSTPRWYWSARGHFPTCGTDTSSSK